MIFNCQVIPVKPEDIEEAERIRKEFPNHGLKGSFTKGQNHIYGIIAEVTIYNFFKNHGFDIQYISNDIGKEKFHYDFIVKHNNNETKFELKTKKTTQEEAYDYWDCSIADFNPNQECDYYLFARITENKDKVFLLGKIKSKDYKDKARFNKKGEPDPNDKYKKPYNTDCTNLNVTKLEPIRLRSSSEVDDI